MKFIADVNIPQLLIKRLINDAQYITDKVLEFIKNNKESMILNSLTIIREDTATSYQYH